MFRPARVVLIVHVSSLTRKWAYLGCVRPCCCIYSRHRRDGYVLGRCQLFHRAPVSYSATYSVLHGSCYAVSHRPQTSASVELDCSSGRLLIPTIWRCRAPLDLPRSIGTGSSFRRSCQRVVLRNKVHITFWSCLMLYLCRQHASRCWALAIRSILPFCRCGAFS